MKKRFVILADRDGKLPPLDRQEKVELSTLDWVDQTGRVTDMCWTFDHRDGKRYIVKSWSGGPTGSQYRRYLGLTETESGIFKETWSDNIAFGARKKRMLSKGSNPPDSISEGPSVRNTHSDFEPTSSDRHALRISQSPVPRMRSQYYNADLPTPPEARGLLGSSPAIIMTSEQDRDCSKSETPQSNQRREVVQEPVSELGSHLLRSISRDNLVYHDRSAQRSSHSNNSTSKAEGRRRSQNKSVLGPQTHGISKRPAERATRGPSLGGYARATAVNIRERRPCNLEDLEDVRPSPGADTHLAGLDEYQLENTTLRVHKKLEVAGKPQTERVTIKFGQWKHRGLDIHEFLDAIQNVAGGWHRGDKVDVANVYYPQRPNEYTPIMRYQPDTFDSFMEELAADEVWKGPVDPKCELKVYVDLVKETA